MTASFVPAVINCYCLLRLGVFIFYVALGSLAFIMSVFTRWAGQPCRPWRGANADAGVGLRAVWRRSFCGRVCGAGRSGTEFCEFCVWVLSVSEEGSLLPL